MRSILHKVRFPAFILAFVVVLGLALFFGLRKTVTLSVDGASHQITTYAVKVGDLLRSQSVSLSSQDQLVPSQDSWLKNGQTVSLVHAIPVQVLADGEMTNLYSHDRTPSDLLAQAGVTLEPGDIILTNGQPVEPTQSLHLDIRSIPLQVVRAVAFTLTADGQSLTLTSAAPRSVLSAHFRDICQPHPCQPRHHSNPIWRCISPNRCYNHWRSTTSCPFSASRSRLQHSLLCRNFPGQRQDPSGACF
jgi:hypothetical protein